jgi:hypothetical protein
MRNIINRIGRAALVAAIILLAVGTVHAQTISNTASVNLNLNISESLTVSASVPSVDFSSSYSASAGTATAPVINVTTSGNLLPGHAWVATYAYLGSASAALSGPSNIPSSDVFASINGSTPLPCTGTAKEQGAELGQTVAGSVVGAACSSSNGTSFFGAGSGIIGFSQSPPAGPYSQADAVTLTLANVPNLMPGAYAGTITFVVLAF